MARSARGNSNYGVKPSSYFYASVEVYLSTFQIAEWYGYGKASADSPMYYAGQYSGDLATGMSVYANMIGTRTLVTSPVFWKFERSLDASEVTLSAQESNAIYIASGNAALDWVGGKMQAAGARLYEYAFNQDNNEINTAGGGGSVSAAPVESNTQAVTPPDPAAATATTTMQAAMAAAKAAAAALAKQSTAIVAGAASQVLVTSAIRGAEETDNSRTRRQGEKEAEAAEEEEAEEENGDE